MKVSLSSTGRLTASVPQNAAITKAVSHETCTRAGVAARPVAWKGENGARSRDRVLVQVQVQGDRYMGSFYTSSRFCAFQVGGQASRG